MSRVLLIKLGAIGDVIMLIPAAHALHLAGHQVDWICGPTVLPLLALYPWINPIPLDDRALLLGSTPAKLATLARIWRILLPRTYGLIATLYYDPRYRLLALPLRARRKLFLSRTDRTLRLLPGRHHTDEYARILLDLPDQARPTPLPPVPVPTAASHPDRLPPSPLGPPTRPRIVLAPAGARNLLADDALRRWPPEHYQVLAALLLARGYEVILIGGPDDRWIAPLFAPLALTNLIGELTLPQTLALLNSADLLITHDTGPLHLAGLSTAGIIALFGPTEPHSRLPQRPGTLALWGGEGFACRPCYDGHSLAPCPSNDCLREVTPEMVFAQALTMLTDRVNGILNPPRILAPARVPPGTSLVTIETHP